MADDRLVPLFRDGQPTDMAMKPADFFSKRTMPKGDVRDAGELVSAADAGYTLGDRFESLELYEGPKTRRQYDHEQEERRAARSAPRTEPAKADVPAVTVADAPKPAEAKK